MFAIALAQTVTDAAAPAQASSATGTLMNFLPLALIFIVFYVLLIRPQQKQMRQRQSMLDQLRKGDRVVTGGGIMGVVHRIGEDDEVQVEIADNVRVRVRRDSIQSVIAKTEPVKDDATNGATGGDGKTTA